MSGFCSCLSFRQIPNKHDGLGFGPELLLYRVILFCRGKRKKAKFIKINGAKRTSARPPGGFFETHISRPFQTVNGLTWPFYIRVIVRTIRMIHGERHRLFRTRGFSLRESVALSSDRGCIQVRLVHWFSFLRSPDLNVSYLFIPALPFGWPLLFYNLSSR